MYFYEKLTKFWLKGDGDMELKERLSEILRLNLAKDYTAVSYAIMVDGKIWAADAIGNDGTEEKKPVTTEHTFNVCSISKMFCTT